jgi:hypothetical protein
MHPSYGVENIESFTSEYITSGHTAKWSRAVIHTWGRKQELICAVHGRSLSERPGTELCGPVGEHNRISTAQVLMLQRALGRSKMTMPEPDRPLVVKCTFDKSHKKIIFQSVRNCSYDVLKRKVIAQYHVVHQLNVISVGRRFCSFSEFLYNIVEGR